MSSRMTSSEAVPEQPGAGSSWWLPAITFLAGCVLGAVVMGVGNVGDDDGPSGPAAAPSAAVAAEAGEDGGATAGDEITGDGADAGAGDSPAYVRVPESCARTADDAMALVEQVDEVVAAVGELDAERLRQAVDDVQQVRDDVQDVAEQCQEAAAESQVEIGDAEGDEVQDAGVEGEDAVVEDPAPTPAS